MTENEGTVDEVAEVEENAEDAEAPEAVEPTEPELPSGPLALGMEAYYAGDYEEALERFEEVLADESYDEDSRVQAAYWRAEALTQRSFTRDAIALFEEVAERYPEHYLGSAATRRAEALRIHFDAIEGKSDG